MPDSVKEVALTFPSGQCVQVVVPKDWISAESPPIAATPVVDPPRHTSGPLDPRQLPAIPMS